MRSKDERAVAAAERKARRAVRYAAVDAKTEARLARIEAWGKPKRAPGDDVPAAGSGAVVPPAVLGGVVDAPPLPGEGVVSSVGRPAVYTPSVLGEVAATFVPGVAMFQAVKMARSERAAFDAMTPDERAALARRIPYGQGGS